MPRHTESRRRLRATAIWLGLAALTLVLAAGNRLWPAAVLRTPLVDALRTCDILVLFVFAPICIWLQWRLLHTVAGEAGATACKTLFVIGVYLLGVGFGMHEPMNALPMHTRLPVALQQSIRFFDDRLGHWIFFSGFLSLVLAVVWAEVRNPLPVRLERKSAVGVIGVGMVFGAVIFANMVREDTAVDLIVLGVTLALTSLLWLRNGRPPCHG